MNQKAHCLWLLAVFSGVACSNAAPSASPAEAGAGGAANTAGAANAQAGQPSSGLGGAPAGAG
ncbi:MAG TPA: hypothetical protein VF294_16420, partial [Polyangiaceae bacterium]